MTTPRDEQAERIRLGLVEYLSRHSLDDDYERRAIAQGHGQRRPGVWGALALVSFALLATVAGVQTSRSADSNAKDRAALIGQIEVRKQVVAEQQQSISLLLAENARLRAQQAGDIANATGPGAGALGVVSGAVPSTGPGVRVTVDDAPHPAKDQQRVFDSDLQRLASGLFEAGAEAVSINGHRLTNLTAIRTAGGAILVDYQPLSHPYVVTAIGDPDTLAARFAQTTFGAAWFDLQRRFGLRLDITTVDSLQVPAAKRLSLSAARVLR